MYVNKSNAIEELKSLPREYPLKLAVLNDDVIIYDSGYGTFNMRRFFEFLNNIDKGIKDKIRISKYYIDGPPTTAILEFDGDIIKYTVDTSRNGIIKEPYVYYGQSIHMDERTRDNRLIRDFLLTTEDGKEITVLYYLTCA